MGDSGRAVDVTVLGCFGFEEKMLETALIVGSDFLIVSKKTKNNVVSC